MKQTLMPIAWQILINGIFQINGFLCLWKFFKKWIKMLFIHLKYVTIFRVLNFYCTMRENIFNNESSVRLDLNFPGNKCNLEL